MTFDTVFVIRPLRYLYPYSTNLEGYCELNVLFESDVIWNELIILGDFKYGLIKWLYSPDRIWFIFIIKRNCENSLITIIQKMKKNVRLYTLTLYVFAISRRICHCQKLYVLMYKCPLLLKYVKRRKYIKVI